MTNVVVMQQLILPFWHSRVEHVTSRQLNKCVYLREQHEDNMETNQGSYDFEAEGLLRFVFLYL